MPGIRYKQCSLTYCMVESVGSRISALFEKEGSGRGTCRCKNQTLMRTSAVIERCCLINHYVHDIL